jgi:hypothetical protein
MASEKTLVGVFTYMDDLLHAVEQVKKRDLDYRVYSPVPNHDLEHALTPQKSPVRFLTSVGAVSGLTFGFALPILCSLDWPLRVSAKDIVSVPGFVVIGYECTILFGGIFTLLALLLFCKIPNVVPAIGYDPRFTDDKFGLVVGVESKMVDSVKSTLMSSGADEVEVRDGL